MNKIVEVLSKLLPADQLDEVSKAVESTVNEMKTELEKEYNTNLEEAYAKLSEELTEAEKIAEEGYAKAFEIIQDQNNRMGIMEQEYNDALEEGYEEAYQELQKAETKNDALSAELYESYNKKFGEAQDGLVESLHQFLLEKGKEIYDEAKRDILSDASMVEHKVVLDRIVESVREYLSDEDRAFSTSTKLDESKKVIRDLEKKVQLLESRSIKLSMENDKLNEAVKHTNQLLTEANNSRKERIERVKKATGRGVVSTNTKLIQETVEPKSGEDFLAESFSADDIKAWKVLGATE